MIRGIACVSTLCISAILFLPSPEALTHKDDKRALLELFRSTNGPTRPQDKGWRLKGAKCVIEKSGEQNCTVPEGWGDDSDPCDDSWFGVVNFVKREGFKVGCTGNAGDPDRRVTGIYLKNNVLRGELPESLGDLVELRELLLPSNGLRGTLPKSVGKLTKLESLWLHNNAISGRIPREIIELRKLKHLILAQNEFSGPVPEGFESLMPDGGEMWLGENKRLCLEPPMNQLTLCGQDKLGKPTRGEICMKAPLVGCKGNEL